ncbi:VOC family protein [Gordonia terrae]|uniref:2,3-dihydroxybiphenyl 1,2-dioxygenase n=2 Tax=Gordonia terrae TaxID=2055 RepID=A0AAD0K9P9_9ACTN|nr:VOC family protein [Gordonia terrae]VTR09600.1 Iron-dependent extradiol dioxygenase [Clostridioides difficile]ANY22211.1 2,3-dihydroxybiphenyl 1,2-dioxygenase [Gordonia terrae]AWO82952.1 2,3-dihydroxybiphenyl 1,2-dioxygenase [Gordonia terrae]VTS29772.1 Iron-dependent extradiol dioxygenase [Gordonia terrae]GAB46321.1 putative extradiol dioxygenase [Gordonia terrae NBRC 100016]
MSEVKGLGYVRVQASDIDRWRELAFEVLGFAEGADTTNDELHLRMDERGARLVVERSEHDRVGAVGWEVRDQLALARLRDRLEKAGHVIKPMSLEEAQARKVEEAFTMDDPGGTPLEFFHGPVLDHSPVITRYGQKFVTGDQGLGHVVVPSPNFDETYRFYTETLGFLPRGAMRLPVPPEYGVQRIRFLGVNQRHHSLAMMPVPEGNDPGLVHIMVEVDNLDAVGMALDQVVKRDFPVSSTLGRHTNDKMISFYVRVPGGWDIEYGTEGALVNEDFYTSEEITADSYWGHEWLWAKEMAEAEQANS